MTISHVPDPNGWNRVPCGRELRSEGEAQRWWGRRVTTGVSRAHEVQVRLVRPPGWGIDGRPRFGVWVREKGATS